MRRRTSEYSSALATNNLFLALCEDERVRGNQTKNRRRRRIHTHTHADTTPTLTLTLTYRHMFVGKFIAFTNAYASVGYIKKNTEHTFKPISVRSNEIDFDFSTNKNIKTKSVSIPSSRFDLSTACIYLYVDFQESDNFFVCLLFMYPAVYLLLFSSSYLPCNGTTIIRHSVCFVCYSRSDTHTHIK